MAKIITIKGIRRIAQYFKPIGSLPQIRIDFGEASNIYLNSDLIAFVEKDAVVFKETNEKTEFTCLVLKGDFYDIMTEYTIEEVIKLIND